MITLAGELLPSLKLGIAFLFMLQSEERGGAHTRPSRRSKSEGPPTTAGAPPGPALSEYRLQYMNMASPPPRAVRSDSDPCVDEEMVGDERLFLLIEALPTATYLHHAA